MAGILCNCGGIHQSVEEWKDCPMALTPRPIDYRERFANVEIKEWKGVTADDEPSIWESRAASIILNLGMLFVIFPIMYLGIGAAKIADWRARRRLRKSQVPAIQEPAKRRPRRAF